MGSEKKQGGKAIRPTSHNINNNGGHHGSEKKNGSNKLNLGGHSGNGQGGSGNKSAAK